MLGKVYISNSVMTRLKNSPGLSRKDIKDFRPRLRELVAKYRHIIFDLSRIIGPPGHWGV